LLLPIADALAKAFAMGLALHEAEKEEVLECNVSRVSSSMLGKIAERVQRPVVKGGAFSMPPPSQRMYGSHAWPLVPDGQGGFRQDERGGYPAAKAFWQDHVVPTGLRIVIKNKPDWMRWQVLKHWLCVLSTFHAPLVGASTHACQPRTTHTATTLCCYTACSTPGMNVRITGGKTDALIVLEDEAEDAEASDDPLQHLLSLVGQVELKTVQAIKVSQQPFGDNGVRSLMHQLH
jgi:hypothetical protein